MTYRNDLEPATVPSNLSFICNNLLYTNHLNGPLLLNDSSGYGFKNDCDRIKQAKTLS